MNEKITYRNSGVDTQAGTSFVSFIKGLQSESDESNGPSFAQNMLKSRMDFAALMDLSFVKEYERPILVSAADGVGTKVHLAQLFNHHKTIGIDLVAMCVNDLLCSGAKPLQFLDYIACGKLEPAERMQEVIQSILKACSMAGCVLAGGETAEHPDTMAPEQYDLAGFALGLVEHDQLIDGSQIKVGDVVIGLPSSGIHANGLSLVRKLYLKEGVHLPAASSERDFLLQQILAKPTLIYEPIVRSLLAGDQFTAIHGLCHITGGGFFENVPRILKPGLSAYIETSSWDVPQVFLQIAERANLSHEEMFHIFNMGMGMLMFVSETEVSSILNALRLVWQKVYPEIPALPQKLGRVEEIEGKQVAVDSGALVLVG